MPKRNSGSVHGNRVSFEPSVCAHYIEGRRALVAQGGGQRGIFTSGVLDAFLYSNFDPFDTFYGTSAGAMNLCAFLCRQPELGKSFLLDLTTDDRFFNLFSFIRQKHYIGLDWALEQVCHRPYKMDIDMGRRMLFDRSAYASVTDATNYHDAYLPMLEANWLDVLRATCAIPNLVSRPITINEKDYVDGGVSASIPVQEAWRREARFIAVIRTEFLDPGGVAVNEQSEIEDLDLPPADANWYQSPVDNIQSLFVRGRKNLSEFIDGRFTPSEDTLAAKRFESLNGGRWLFGANNVYRIAHLLGNNFDSGLADMLMVHYQTYALTQEFIASPPEDCFVMQILPHSPLRTSSLMSSPEDLLFDYHQGLAAGYRFVDEYDKLTRYRLQASLRA